jgi:tRNA(Ile)-lysidine synthase
MTGTADGSTATDGIPRELVTRFAAEVERLLPEGGRIGLAVSGGPDSIAMLLLAHAAIPGRFEVATVNHGLRPEAAEECALVVAACDARGIPCEVLTVVVGEGNVQEQARLARYAALAKWAAARGLAAIATAHHADDQAETLLMRLNRGSGVAGLAGIRGSGVTPGGGMRVIRPLLSFRRQELGQVVQAAGVATADDPSNADDRFDRVRIRKALADCDWLDPAALAQSARNLADAYEALQAYADLLWPAQVREVEGAFSLTPGPSREMNRRLVARVMEQLGGRPRGGDVARLLMRLERGEGGNVAGVLATVDGSEWVFRPEPQRRTG